MAVVFISPKKKQKAFFTGITISLVLFLIVISLWIFLANPSAPTKKIVFNKPKVTIDLSILDTEQFKKLDHFELMPLQFVYTALNEDGETVKGFVSAVSQEEAVSILEQSGLEVGSVKEAGLGRDNPFLPY